MTLFIDLSFRQTIPQKGWKMKARVSGAHQIVGHWLKGKREKVGLSKAEFGAIIGHRPSYISRYEAGQRLEVCDFVMIAKALNASPHDVISLLAKPFSAMTLPGCK